MRTAAPTGNSSIPLHLIPTARAGQRVPPAHGDSPKQLPREPVAKPSRSQTPITPSHSGVDVAGSFMASLFMVASVLIGLITLEATQRNFYGTSDRSRFRQISNHSVFGHA